MDALVGSAIVAALLSGATAGATDVGRAAIADAYGALKAYLHKKFGEQSALANTIRSLQDKPECPHRQAALKEEAVSSGAESEPEALRLAELLLSRVPSGSINAPTIKVNTTNAVGNGNIQAVDGSSIRFG